MSYFFQLLPLPVWFLFPINPTEISNLSFENLKSVAVLAYSVLLEEKIGGVKLISLSFNSDRRSLGRMLAASLLWYFLFLRIVWFPFEFGYRHRVSVACALVLVFSVEFSIPPLLRV